MKTKELKVVQLLKTSFYAVAIMGITACGGNNTETVAETELGEETVGVETENEGLFDNNRFNTDFTNTNYYEDWDMNDDSFLDENEFSEGYYNTWDNNNDGKLDENEWNTGVKDYRQDATQWSWSDWDKNKNNVIEKDEFTSGFNNANYYSDWDADKDKRLNEREYTDGIFGQWDENDDGRLEETEYSSMIERYYGG